MIETIRKFSDRNDILTCYNELLKNEPILDTLLEEIMTLTRGNVKPQDTLKRSKIGAYFTSSIQQLRNFCFKHDISLTKRMQENLGRISYKADKVLRENIVLQTVPPLDVIPYKHVPKRHSYSTYGRRERRWGYALHKKPFNEDGHSVTVADMPPHYTQSIHNHTLSEYCLVLDSRIEGIYYPGGKREKIYSTNQSEMLHFSATTPHTLKNPSKRRSRNITYKQATGLIDWRPISDLNTVKIVRARLLKGKIRRVSEKQTKKSFTVKDKYYDYTIEVLRLKKGETFKKEHDHDQYIFVISGKLTVSHKDIRKSCKRNDFIVIDKNTKYTIETGTTCRLYTIKQG